MRRYLSATIALAAVLLLPGALSAWNATGHRTIAEIAWQNMTPRARARAVELLLHGPPLAGLQSLRPATGTTDERDRALFLNASTWPDLVRDRDKPWHAYNRPTWHYADFYWDVENGAPHDIPGTHPDSVNAGERIDLLRAALADPSLPDTARAVDLAWILHLVADIHQPLHASSRVTAQEPLPLGDKGGNDVRLDGRLNLHWFWDSILDEGVPRLADEDSIAYATRIADLIVAAHPRASMQPAADSQQVSAWERESLLAAQRQVYDGIVRGSAPSAAYREAALRTSEARMALAGYRLAALLNQALK
ncbi:MAG: S1/P1 nuclease [Gemmatimonadota bacterium]|nr:S1/P1 nuclease [Gemmatimonadota bacterium]